jgi:hypothetical protein
MSSPQVNDFVIVYFRTGQQISGNVVYWSNDVSELQSESKTSKLVINNTLQDVLYYKIFTGKKEYKNIIETPTKSDDDIKRLAELKKEFNEIEKQDFKEKIFENKKSEVREINYGLPLSALKVTSPTKHTEEKTARTSTRINSELQNLFKQKNKSK